MVKISIRDMLDWVWRLAISVDQFFNVFLSPLLNFLLKPVFRFGHPDETLSSVFGKNIRAGKCRFCSVICKVLEWFDKDHCKESIEDDRGLT